MVHGEKEEEKRPAENFRLASGRAAAKPAKASPADLAQPN
jgi:hypothetical protein